MLINSAQEIKTMQKTYIVKGTCNVVEGTGKIGKGTYDTVNIPPETGSMQFRYEVQADSSEQAEAHINMILDDYMSRDIKFETTEESKGRAAAAMSLQKR
jgi:hypothetical protein